MTDIDLISDDDLFGSTLIVLRDVQLDDDAMVTTLLDKMIEKAEARVAAGNFDALLPLIVQLEGDATIETLQMDRGSCRTLVKGLMTRHGITAEDLA